MHQPPTKIQLLEQIIDRHQNKLFRFAFFRTGSYAEAEDIVQEVLLRLFSSTQNLSHVENVEPYLMRAIANRCNDYHRKRHVQTVGINKAASLPQESDDTVAKEYARIASLLDTLPPEQAEVIRMRTVDGLPFWQIAELTNTPLPSVKSRFRYGLARLRQLITNHH